MKNIMKACVNCTACECIAPLFKGVECILKNYVAHVNYLAIRLYVGLIFWRSADTKVTGDGLFGLPDSVGLLGVNVPLISMPFEISEDTFFLFAEEYKVPFLPTTFATYAATLAEIFLALMLIFGFGGRIAAAGLLVMTMVIHFTYMMNDEHYYWMMALMVIVCVGPGKVSIDHMIRSSMERLKPVWK